MKRPRDIADRSRELRDVRKLRGDGFLQETFTLPLHAAGLKDRRILDEYPPGGYMTVVENWPASRRTDRIRDATAADRDEPHALQARRALNLTNQPYLQMMAGANGRLCCNLLCLIISIIWWPVRSNG
jgi:hypothetical protein